MRFEILDLRCGIVAVVAIVAIVTVTRKFINPNSNRHSPIAYHPSLGLQLLQLLQWFISPSLIFGRQASLTGRGIPLNFPEK